MKWLLKKENKILGGNDVLPIKKIVIYKNSFNTLDGHSYTKKSTKLEIELLGDEYLIFIQSHINQFCYKSEEEIFGQN